VFRELKGVEGVVQVEETPSLIKIYGKGSSWGGAQSAGRAGRDRRGGSPQHSRRANSADTIPLVGEMELAAAVRRRPVAARQAARACRLAHGREITRAVDDVRQKGIYVISLNMAEAF
jgi:uncharacterized protein with ACT and thioredoxin-like domain